MAVTYGETQTKDTDGKKFQGVLTDTGSATNEFYAVKGVNKATQNSETVADMSVAVSTASGAGAAIGATSDAAVVTDTTGTVIGFLRGIVAWFVRLGQLDGATFTSGSSYVWSGLGGVYQSTVTLLEAGKTGLMRLSERRAGVMVPDVKVTTIVKTAAEIAGGGADLYTMFTPMDGCKSINIVLYNGTDVSLDWSLLVSTAAGAEVAYLVAAQTLTAGSRQMAIPATVSTNASAGVIPAPGLSSIPHGYALRFNHSETASPGTVTTGIISIDITEVS